MKNLFPILLAISGGVLYQFRGNKVMKIADRIGPHAFAATESGAAYWNGTLVAQKLD